MARKKMRRYLKKPKTSKNKTGQVSWRLLYSKALDMTSEVNIQDDPRVRLLRGYPEEKAEEVLRRLSIINKVDLLREFGEYLED